eukprot:Phypoly_transcript_18518.p1 GENE.Phypoly_transcript_18518~~Phypoly_transcript_18518.p1  ORF type:complete len:200 (+),score=19.33 Phypoly_transcript_18518:102-701(+)
MIAFPAGAPVAPPVAINPPARGRFTGSMAVNWIISLHVGTLAVALTVASMALPWFDDGHHRRKYFHDDFLWTFTLPLLIVPAEMVCSTIVFLRRNETVHKILRIMCLANIALIPVVVIAYFYGGVAVGSLDSGFLLLVLAYIGACVSGVTFNYFVRSSTPLHPTPPPPLSIIVSNMEDGLVMKELDLMNTPRDVGHARL